MSHVCDASCAHTIDVGYAHVLTAPRADGGVCLDTCPHPEHRPARPALNTQARIIYDHAEEQHDGLGHTGDVRECAECRAGRPYGVLLRHSFPTPTDVCTRKGCGRLLVEHRGSCR